MAIVPAARVQALPQNFFGALDAAVAAARAAGVDVIDVSKGNPDLPTPPAIVEVMQAAVADPRNHGYPTFTPRPNVTAAIAKRYREDHGVDVDPRTEVAVFHGSHEALMAAVLGFVNPGETFIIPDPGYPAYLSAAEFAGAEVRTLPLLRETGYQPDFASLSGLERASVLLLNYPHNPTGAVAKPETYEAAAAEAARLGGVLVNDWAYSTLGFNGRPVSALVADRERTVEVSTLSKAYNMAGWRLGYAVGAPDAIAAMRRYQSHAFSTIFGATQDAAAAALDGDQTAANDLVDVYRSRRDLVVDGLRAQGWDVVAADGAFFVWIALDGAYGVDGGADDVAFARRLLTEHGVAVAPGSGFGKRGAGHIRISLVHPHERLAALVERLSGVQPRGVDAAAGADAGTGFQTAATA